MANSPSKELRALEEQHDCFISETAAISRKQEQWLGKVIELFQEQGAVQDQMSGTTKGRRQTAHRTFKNIFQRFGYEIFFLCTFALSITYIGTLKRTSVLFKEIEERREWAVPSPFYYIARDLYERHKESLSGPDSQPANNSQRDAVAHDVSESRLPKRPRTASHDEATNSSCRGSVECFVHNADNNHKSDLAPTCQTKPLFKGKQYTLSPMETVHMLTTNPVHAWLTIPDNGLEARSEYLYRSIGFTFLDFPDLT
ncbi:hypothetical protein AK830_g9980 [Neonectria ditissima]|uniref:Uncharacterized protein n=1 Tax=Neonectria ditissima TaxID=78410 RepID=A0A0P7AGR2_9HYPO|nr:hypothetical protein AK830_g9980 [Neonectria ditissima]